MGNVNNSSKSNSNGNSNSNSNSKQATNANASDASKRCVCTQGASFGDTVICLPFVMHGRTIYKAVSVDEAARGPLVVANDVLSEYYKHEKQKSEPLYGEIVQIDEAIASDNDAYNFKQGCKYNIVTLARTDN